MPVTPRVTSASEGSPARAWQIFASAARASGTTAWSRPASGQGRSTTTPAAPIPEGYSAVAPDALTADMLEGANVRDMTDATQAELPFVQFMRGLLEAKGIDPASSGNLNYGTFFGFPLIQAFILAGEFPGGLTRTNFILAQWMMDITHPFVIEGNDLVTKGVEDAYPIEGGIYQQYSVEKQAFVKQSDVISLAGESPPCAWNQSTSTCE